jgi:single-strand DNA-binding protein
MSDLNVWTAVGRLVRDAEAPQGNGPTRLSIAVNRRVKHGEEWIEEASFFDLEYWHKSLVPFLVKGKQIAVRGELRQERWTSPEGQARQKIGIVALDIELLGSAQGSPQSASGAAGHGNAPESRGTPPPASSQGQSGGDEFTDDIPF